MYLKRLEAHGFKSFAHRIGFDFHRGVTGIVGPNGCGKSNVVDAIKWALGDMSTKSLRSDEMLDVIFKGASGVAPMGYAEVSLTFDNADRRLPIEFDEVSVTRRLHRTGESEYLLNRAPCRLKDIRELFYGTGVGRDSYSIIEQGDINFLVNASPVERRAFFEEAAGISLYKARRREAESKLASVAQNLEVLGAEIRGVASEVRSLKIQAGRAERYRQCQEERKRKQTDLALHEYRGGREALEAVRGRLAGLEAERAAAAQALAAAREAVAAAEADVRAREEALEALRASVLAAASQTAALEEGLRAEEARQAEFAARQAEGAAERERQDAATQAAAGRLDAARAACEEARAGAEALRARLAEAEQALAQADAACEEARAAIERRKAEAIETLRQRAERQHTLVERQAERRAAAAARERALEQKARWDAEHAALRDANTELAARLDGIDREIAESKSEHELVEIQERDLQKEIAALGDDCDRLRDAREKALTREDLLRDLEARLEGLGSGAKVLLRGGERAAVPAGEPPPAAPGADASAPADPAIATGRFPGVVGTVADILRVDATHVRAIENLLGERAGWLVAETAVQSLAAVDYIRARGLDWVCVIPRNVLSDPAVEPVQIPEGARPATGCVAYDPADAGVVRFLLGNHWIVPDREAAIAFLRAAPPGAGVATLEGQVLGPQGTVGGGARESAVSLLSRRAELAALSGDLHRIADELDTKANLFAERESELVRLREHARELHYRVYDLNVEAQTPRTRLEEGRKREEVLAREIEMSRQELERLDAQDAALAGQERTLQQVLVELEGLAKTIEEEVRGREQELARYEASREELRGRASAVRTERAEAETRRAGAEDTVARELRGFEEAREVGARLAAQLDELARRADECAASCARKREALDRARREREEGEARLREAEAARAAAVEGLQARRGEADAAADRDRALEQEVNSLRLEEQQHAMTLDHLVQGAAEECGVDLREAFAAWQPPEGFDPAAVRAEVAELRRRMEAMGNVNLAAIDDLQSRELRLASLSSQEQDLVKARAELEELIRKLNRESRERFAETIEKVRAHFKETFRKLFGGGNADLVVQEGVDLLEAGIDIVAKPPHKDFTSLHLLSGGEKTLTTLALVMAIFQTQPSPFCLLDEADAALDEKNVGRYATLVRDFAKDTQFLLVTHNKRTMTAADILYGVTMQTPGVSKRVTVSLEAIEAENGEVKAVEPEAALAGAGG